MKNYEVTLMGKVDRLKWSMFFMAESFAHAEEQCKDALTDHDREHSVIIAIEMDY